MKPYFKFLLILLVAAGMTGRSALAAEANAFNVESVNSRLDGSVYFLNTVFNIEFPEFIISAVQQGFDLPLVMEIEVYKNRKLWFDEKLVTIKQQYRIHYHNILNAYSILDVNAGSRRYFASLEEVISHLSVLINYPMLDNNTLSRDNQYEARLRFGVDVIELPIPLKSSSLWKNNWELSSEWQQWTVNP